jgi:hypothetical protein
LLNITNNIVAAKLGDYATVFGFADNRPRTWKGNIAGYLGHNTTGKHFCPQVPENAKELLFQGSQDMGMSGGGAINGKGKINF